jgi:hypothetical protein
MPEVPDGGIKEQISLDIVKRNKRKASIGGGFTLPGMSYQSLRLNTYVTTLHNKIADHVICG